LSEPAVIKKKSFKGFLVATYDEDGYLYIRTRGSELEYGIFISMIEFLLQRLAKAKYIRALDIINSINVWVKFGKSNSKELSEAIQYGLFAEILFLVALKEAFGEEKALSAWRGPEKLKVDYVISNTLAVEIKANKDPLANVITITSIEQLSDGFTNHYLRHYKLIQNPLGQTVKDLFNEVLFSIEDYNVREEFSSKNLDYGFNYLADYDNLLQISSVGFEDYDVSSNNFPKLKGPIDPRIRSIKYSLSLDSVDSLDSEEVFSQIIKSTSV